MECAVFPEGGGVEGGIFPEGGGVEDSFFWRALFFYRAVA